MSGRLFWKTLGAFFVTYLVASYGALPMFPVFSHSLPISKSELSDRLDPLLLNICLDAVRQAGPAQCRARLSRLAPADAPDVLVEADHAGRDQDGSTVSLSGAPPAVIATAADGRRYLISVRKPQPSLLPAKILDLPLEVFLLGWPASLAFSAALAWYVLAPLRQLKRGFAELAGGNFSARVSQGQGNRRDEIAELASDFDRMAQRLQDAYTLRDQFLHDASHELKSPIYRLKLSIDLARQDHLHYRPSLDRMEREAVRLGVLVDDLLLLTRAENGSSHLQDCFDLGDLLASILDDAEFEAAAKGIQILRSSGCGDRECLLYGDPELIHRAIENVVRNAIRFSPLQSSVAVQFDFEAGAGTYIIRVIDEGPGAPEPLRSRMFEPFVTGPSSKGGAGLGLSIAQRAIRAHGGEIRANNKLGKGLCVSISLPALSTSEQKELANAR